MPIRNLYSSTKDTLEKAKYKNILLDVIAPKMDEMLCAIRENYGEEIFMDYEILKLNSSNYSYKAYLLEKYVHEGENNG